MVSATVVWSWGCRFKPGLCLEEHPQQTMAQICHASLLSVLIPAEESIQKENDLMLTQEAVTAAPRLWSIDLLTPVQLQTVTRSTSRHDSTPEVLNCWNPARWGKSVKMSSSAGCCNAQRRNKMNSDWRRRQQMQLRVRCTQRIKQVSHNTTDGRKGQRQTRFLI